MCSRNSKEASVAEEGGEWPPVAWEKQWRQIPWEHVGHGKDSGFHAEKDRKGFWTVLSKRGL